MTESLLSLVFIMIDDDLKGILNFPFFLLLHKSFAIYPTKVDMILFRSFFSPPKRQHYVVKTKQHLKKYQCVYIWKVDKIETVLLSVLFVLFRFGKL